MTPFGTRTPEEIRALSIVGRMRGRIKSTKKAEASRRNGRLGGRPRKPKP